MLRVRDAGPGGTGGSYAPRGIRAWRMRALVEVVHFKLVHWRRMKRVAQSVVLHIVVTIHIVQRHGISAGAGAFE